MKGLKADLHTHADYDEDSKMSYTSRDLIRFVAKKGFEVLAITHHNKLVNDKALIKFAKKRNVLLIPGVEKRIQGKEVLLYDLTQEIYKKIKKLEDLERYRHDIPLIIAPHPFFIIPQCLGNKMLDHIHSFDAIEYSHFYTSLINRNKKAVKIAKKYGLPMIGTSDAHHLYQVDHTFSIIHSDKDKGSVIEAVKKSRTQLVSSPLSFFSFIKTSGWAVMSQIK